MQTGLLDTDILSLFLRGDANVVENAREYLQFYPTLNFSIITYYEILSGLYRRDARKQLHSFSELASNCHIVLVDPSSVDQSAKLYAELHKSGNPLDDVDLLIAGVALANGWSLVTHNTRHFDRISGLILEDWTLPRA